MTIDDDGTARLRLGEDKAQVDIEDTPWVVTQVEGAPPDGFTVVLNDETREPLDPETLTVGADNVLYCRVKGGRHAARFLRPAYYELMRHAAPRIGRRARAAACGRRRIPLGPDAGARRPGRARDPAEHRLDRPAVRRDRHAAPSDRAARVHRSTTSTCAAPASTTGRTSLDAPRELAGVPRRRARPGGSSASPRGRAALVHDHSLSRRRRARLRRREPRAPAGDPRRASPTPPTASPSRAQHVRSLNLANAVAIVLYEGAAPARSRVMTERCAVLLPLGCSPACAAPAAAARGRRTIRSDADLERHAHRARLARSSSCDGTRMLVDPWFHSGFATRQTEPLGLTPDEPARRRGRAAHARARRATRPRRARCDREDDAARDRAAAHGRRAMRELGFTDVTPLDWWEQHDGRSEVPRDGRAGGAQRARRTATCSRATASRRTSPATRAGSMSWSTSPTALSRPRRRLPADRRRARCSGFRARWGPTRPRRRRRC